MASFQAKIGWKGREREKIKRIVPMNCYETRNRKFKKLKKHHYGFFLSQNKLGKAKKEWKKKKKKSFQWVPTQPVIKNSKKIAKKFLKKIKKHHCGLFPSQNKLGKAEKERK